MSSKIIIRSTDVEKPVSSQEVDDLKRQLAEMQKLMEKMIATNSVKADAPAEVTNDKKEDTHTELQAKRAGRRANTKK
jgi:hypothetical protein